MNGTVCYWRNLGGGRLAKDSIIQPEVGVDRLAKPGDSVREGDLLVRVHAMNTDGASRAIKALAEAFDYVS